MTDKLTPEIVLQALADAQAGKYPSMEINADTPDAVVDAFLFGDEMKDIDRSECPLVIRDPDGGDWLVMKSSPRVPVQGFINSHLDGGRSKPWRSCSNARLTRCGRSLGTIWSALRD
jgi:hypothetical protein